MAENNGVNGNTVSEQEPTLPRVLFGNGIVATLGKITICETEGIPAFSMLLKFEPEDLETFDLISQADKNNNVMLNFPEDAVYTMVDTPVYKIYFILVSPNNKPTAVSRLHEVELFRLQHAQRNITILKNAISAKQASYGQILLGDREHAKHLSSMRKTFNEGSK